MNRTMPPYNVQLTRIATKLRHGESVEWNRPLVRDLCEKLLARLEREQWRGKSGKTDRAVMMVALGLAHHFGHLDLFLAERDLALSAGVTPKTANKSLHRLIKAGWLIYVAKTPHLG